MIEQTLAAHRVGQHFLTVSTLLPHLEGVMTDWVEAKSPGTPFRQVSKTKKFRELATANPDHSHVYRRVVDSAVDFILDGPVLATFKQWFDNFETTFANRNVVGHGRYDERVDTEENSVKLFLMLDTIYQTDLTAAPFTGYCIRHRSAFRFVEGMGPAVAFILSQDGGIKAATMVDGKVLVWSYFEVGYETGMS